MRFWDRGGDEPNEYCPERVAALCRENASGHSMKTILDKTFPADGIRVLVSEHEDSPDEYIISLERGGLSESVCSVEELRFVAGAIAAAATRIAIDDA